MRIKKYHDYIPIPCRTATLALESVSNFSNASASCLAVSRLTQFRLLGRLMPIKVTLPELSDITVDKLPALNIISIYTDDNIGSWLHFKETIKPKFNTVNV